MVVVAAATAAAAAVVVVVVVVVVKQLPLFIKNNIHKRISHSTGVRYFSLTP